MAPIRSDTAPKAARRGTVAAGILLSSLLIGILGCAFPFPTLPDSASDNSNDNSEAPQPTPPPQILLRLANSTDAAVDAMLFVSTNALADPVNELFVDAYSYRETIGLAGTGILVPQATDSAVIPCGPGLTLGTSGGVFLDAESGEELGTGQSRILQQGLVFDCGDIVTLVYFSNDGEYGVDVGLQ